MNNKIIIMYHSVASEEIPAVTGSFPISMDRFKDHIQLLKSNGYEFDFISNIHKINKNKKIAYITGDDGTTDWTRNVLPWCEKTKFLPIRVLSLDPGKISPLIL
jgi:peptidoglycan/xylan/chitin deacetylase (PgdA/CDA1 family)